MNAQTQYFSISGRAGNLQCAINLPEANPRGLALVAHPHPLFAGTMDNKVTQTLARAFLALDYVAVRMNFRGVGESAGSFDEGVGETEDMYSLLQHMRQQYPDLPLALAGFSFGSYVQACLQQRLQQENQAAERLVLVGAAAGKWAMPEIPANSILIHGELDDTIPLSAVLDWLRPQDIPVSVIPGADHFFHKRLHHIKNLVMAQWQR